MSTSVSVVIATHNRPAMVLRAVRSAMNAGVTEVVVVDDHSNDPDQAPALTELARWSGVTVLESPGHGASAARNHGATRASGNLVGFIDDDVVLDAQWVAGLAGAIRRWPGVGLITGPVRAAELDTRWQQLFESRVGWDHGGGPDLFGLHDRGRGRLYPFRPGAFGTGANFVIRRDVFAELGGFDETMGPGTTIPSGEDVDLFVRAIRAHHRIGYEPELSARHSHRSTEEAYRAQLRDYGRGLGAWFTKLLVEPGRTDLLRAVLRAPLAGSARIPVGVRSRVAWRDGRVEEWRGLAAGPWRYVSQTTASQLKRYRRVVPSENASSK